MQNGPPEFDNPADNFVRLFQHYDFLARDQGDERIGSLLDKLDQVGVHDEGLVIQTCEPNHASPPFPGRDVRGGRTAPRRNIGTAKTLPYRVGGTGAVTEGLRLAGSKKEARLKQNSKLPMEREEIRGSASNARSYAEHS